MQRFCDLMFCIIFLLLLWPVLIAVMILLSFTGEGEVFYSQKRVGINGKLFNLLKFATMLKHSPSIGTGTVTLKNDPRVLPVGKFLRKTKLNELPQLLNILIGDMSFVGPRPQTERCFAAFPEDIQTAIIKVKPGLSGIGSIIFRDEEEMLAHNNGSLDFYDNVISPYKGALEVWYVEHKCLQIYFMIIFVTIWVVIYPSSGVVWRLFPDLPAPPDVLKEFLSYGAVQVSDP